MIKCRKSIEGLMPYVPGRPIEAVQKEYGLQDVVKLASNENPYGASPRAIEAAKDSFENVNLYPDGACLALKAALAEKLCVRGEEIVLGAGADEVVSLIIQAFIETGDEMVTAQTTFGQYAAATTAMGGSVVLTPMKNDGYDLDAIAAAITDKTKIVFITNPNNPTGTLIKDNEKMSFLERVPRSVLVVFDEAYQEFVEDKDSTSSVPLVAKYENLIVLKTFSKAYGLAALRVGYGILKAEYASCLEKVRKPFNVSIPAQAAAIAALDDQDFVTDTVKRNIEVKHFCYQELDGMGISYVKTEANFIAIDSPIDSMDAFVALMKKGYIVRPNAFGMKNRLRVTLGTMEQMKGFFEELKQLKK